MRKRFGLAPARGLEGEQAQERLGQLDAARESWNTVIRVAPDSTAGQLAKQNLDRVARRPTP